MTDKPGGPPAERPSDDPEKAREPGPDTAAGPAPTPDTAPPPPAGAAQPPPAGAAVLPLGYAAAIAVLLVVAAIGAGLAIGTMARPSPTPAPTPARTIATPVRTPVPTTDPQVFRQQLSSGCATGQGIWVVSSGGALIRYDGEHWTQVDSTLRTHTYAACDEQTMYAVGPVGAVLILDDRARSINSFDVTIADLRGAAAMPQGAMVSGTGGTVMLLSGGTWHVYAGGIEEDLNALLVFGLQSAWAVGSQGISYRLEPAGWRPIKTGVDVTLRAIAGANVQSAIAAGDGGTILALSDLTWSKVESGTNANLRAIALVGPTAWIVGDNGVVLTVDGALVTPGSPIPAKPAVIERIDIATTCALTGVFVRGQDVWIVGASGGRGGVWRVRDKKVAERWGEC